MWSSLEEFAHWYKENNCPIEPTIDVSVCTTDISSSFAVYRNKNYQVEMYIVKPNTSTPEHGHPGIENLIMYIGGDIKYVHNGIDIHLTKNSQTPVLRDGDKHALHSGPRGAVFYSIEKWPDGSTPLGIANVWDGAAVGAQHEKIIQEL